MKGCRLKIAGHEAGVGEGGAGEHGEGGGAQGGEPRGTGGGDEIAAHQVPVRVEGFGHACGGGRVGRNRARGRQTLDRCAKGRS